MGDDSFVIGGEGYLASLARSTRRRYESVNESVIKEEVVAIDEHLFIVKGDILEGIHLDFHGAVFGQDIALIEPERLVENSEVPGRLVERWYLCPVTNDDLFHGM